MDPLLPKFNPREQAGIQPFFFMHEGEVCVKIQIAGDTRFAPVFRADDLAFRDGLTEVTYKDRFPDQYRQFVEGSAQVADGTPLEQADFLNPSRIAELRAIKVYNIEALASLDDRNIPRLGGKGYELKHLAQQFLANRLSKASDRQIADMAAQIAELQALLRSTAPVSAEAQPAGEYTRLKEEIKAKTGSYPRGNPSLETLQRIVAEIGTGTPVTE